MTFCVFDASRFAELREARGITLGSPASAVLETGSTNDDALAAVKDGAPHGAVFVAESQTRGRGRRGHTWTSPPSANLTFSLLLRPRVPAERVAQLALVAGLAVRAAVAPLVNEPIAVKWPNDVVLGRRKLAGILVESRLSGAIVEAVVVGIGLNVHMDSLPPDIAAVATSLALLGAEGVRREALLVDVLAAFEVRLGRFLSHGPHGAGLAPLLDELRVHDALLDQSITVGGVRGVGAGIAEDGSLLVRDGEGRVHPVNSGTVERL
jgi:BirA family biotin operon repressor/biotin-[acetyl-CoA-carboxylase] ligase